MNSRINAQGQQDLLVGQAPAAVSLRYADGSFEGHGGLPDIDVSSLLLMANSFVEEERQHIAQEMHDELGQILFALGLHLSLLQKRVGTQLPDVVNEVEIMKTLIVRAIGSVHHVSSQLRPPELAGGLVPAIASLCQEFTDFSHVVCRLHAPDVAVEMDDLRTLMVYRIVQESLSNITRYAKASGVDIRFGRCGNVLCVKVCDNGCGFDPEQPRSRKKTIGLFGMHERAAVLGGRVNVRSQVGQGTVVELELPLCAALKTPLQ
ncbi:MAG: two-component system NarL family sensor histidine kinase UhpB [Comamonadaceae bacterium]|nr:MAG: two-component system NarL family sensor histidine kinase UhpB [Comamonadaceae bacterium]